LALNEPNLFLIAGVVIALCGGLLLLTRDRGEAFDPLTWWAVAMLLGGAGVLLLAGFRDLPPILYSVLSRALMLLAIGTSWTAARVFSGRSPRPLLAVAGGVAWVVICELPATRGNAFQTCFASFVGALYVLAAAAELWRGRAERLRSRNPAIILLCIHFAALVVRGWMAIGPPDAAIQGQLTFGLLLESMLHTIGMAFLLLALTKERAQQQVLASVEAERRTNQARSRFLAHMSHELRTPLNGLLGFAQLLAADQRLSETQRAQVDLLERAGRHLLSLANDALDLMRIDAGRLDLDILPTDLADAIRTCVAIVQPRAQEKLIDLITELREPLPQRILGDRVRLQQVLLNLLSNAIKFTPAGGQVRVIASAQEFTIRLEVTDTGPGIPEDRQGQLFQDFARPQSRPAEPGEGAGLGLSICAGIVRAMEGTIAYQPGPRGIGSCFSVELPLRALPQERAPAPGTEVSGPSSRRRLRVLAVDDVRSNRLLLKALLEAEGHEVTLAESGVAAIGMIEATRFDVVLMDVRMPDLDGLEVTRHVRGLAGSAGRIPIIGVSADAARHDVSECLAAGMTGHVAKPFERERLLEEVHRAAASGPR
jgi:signal transduction histidine kinase/ActR/RegA family two-component response regulator